MLERTEQRFGLKRKLLAADTAYGSGPMLDWLFEQKGNREIYCGLGERDWFACRLKISERL
jgi:hypothetical protein